MAEWVVVSKREAGIGEDFKEKAAFEPKSEIGEEFKRLEGRREGHLSRGHSPSRIPEACKEDKYFGNVEARGNIQNILTLNLED